MQSALRYTLPHHGMRAFSNDYDNKIMLVCVSSVPQTHMLLIFYVCVCDDYDEDAADDNDAIALRALHECEITAEFRLHCMLVHRAVRYAAFRWLKGFR